MTPLGVLPSVPVPCRCADSPAIPAQLAEPLRDCRSLSAYSPDNFTVGTSRRTLSSMELWLSISRAVVESGAIQVRLDEPMAVVLSISRGAGGHGERP